MIKSISSRARRSFALIVALNTLCGAVIVSGSGIFAANASSNVTLSVSTQYPAGQIITGLWTTLSANKTVVQTGFSPVSFTLIAGANGYVVTATNYHQFVFDHWQDTGSTQPRRSITITQNTALVAIYRPPTMTINPNTGSPGTQVSATGNYFASSHAITIEFDGTAVATNPSTVKSNGTGGFTATFNVTSTVPGSHSVSASDGTSTVSQPFTVPGIVPASISLSPTSGLAGTIVKITGSNFAPSSTITISYNGTVVTTVPTPVMSDSTGAFSANFTVPSPATNGPNTVSAKDLTKSANATFTVSGNVRLTVAAQDQNSNALSGLWTVLTQGATTIGSGFTTITYTVTSGIQYSIGVGNYKTFFFDHWMDNSSTVNPRSISINSDTKLVAIYRVTHMTINPTSGGPGTNVTLRANAFTPNHAITVAYDNASIATSPSSIVSNSTGGFVATLLVPNSSSAGTHIIAASDGTLSVTNPFTVVTPPPPVGLYPPMDLLASSTSTSSINLSWTAPQQNGTSGGTVVFGYKVERSGDGGTTWSTIVSNTGTTSTAYTDSGITSGTQESYRVSSLGSSGTSSSPSNVASATTLKTGITTPTIAINTNTAFVGNDIRVTGFMFAPNSQIALTYDNTNITFTFTNPAPVPSTVMTNSTGNFVAIIPAIKSAVGTHSITARDSMNNVASQTITILPHVFIYPSSGYAGSQVLVPSGQGNGFGYNSTITLIYDSSILPFSPATDSQGSFGGQFTVPAGSNIGLHTLKFSDSKGNSYSTSFLVTSSSTPMYYSKTLVTGFSISVSFAFIPDKGPNVDGSGNLMVIEKNTGNVFVVKHYVNGTFAKQSVPFVTIPNLQTGFEDNGLLGITFDPNYVNSKYVYFYLTRNVSGSVVGDVVRYQAMNDSSGNIVANPLVGEQLVMGNIPNWQDGHNGGHLRFDSAGNLYISVSDGWTFVKGQDLTSLQAKILRITPLASPVNGKLYSIPSTNPFASSTNSSIRKEIWGYGIRNVFSFDIDQPTGKVYASDVSYNTWERIDNFTAPARNAAWPLYEGPIGSNPQNLSNYTPQIYWYPHDGLRPLGGPTKNLVAIQGAAFYHGSYYPNLDGAYLFGDYGVGFIQAMLPSSTAPAKMDYATGTPKAQVAPLLYGLMFSPEGLAEWNSQIYFIDFSSLNVLKYDTNSSSASIPCTTCTLTVNSQLNTGDLLNGMYTELRNQTGALLSTGFTPVSFTVHNGTQYSVGVGNYQNHIFDHWLDTGSAIEPRTITLSTSMALTAVYRDADLTVSPAKGPFDVNVTVTGAGFTPNHIVTLTYDGFGVTSYPSSILTSASGGFVVTLTVPSGSVGPHRVQASDGTNIHATIYTVGAS